MNMSYANSMLLAYAISICYAYAIQLKRLGPFLHIPRLLS